MAKYNPYYDLAVLLVFIVFLNFIFNTSEFFTENSDDRVLTGVIIGICVCLGLFLLIPFLITLVGIATGMESRREYKLNQIHAAESLRAKVRPPAPRLVKNAAKIRPE